MEKYFDAKDMRNVIDDIEWVFSRYREHSDGLIGCYEKYRDNELFQGEVAEASKLFIDKNQIPQARAQDARKYHAFSPDHIDGSVVEFCGHDIDFDMNKYELEGIKIINEK